MPRTRRQAKAEPSGSQITSAEDKSKGSASIVATKKKKDEPYQLGVSEFTEAKLESLKWEELKDLAKQHKIAANAKRVVITWKLLEIAEAAAAPAIPVTPVEEPAPANAPANDPTPADNDAVASAAISVRASASTALARKNKNVISAPGRTPGKRRKVVVTSREEDTSGKNDACPPASHNPESHGAVDGDDADVVSFAQESGTKAVAPATPPSKRYGPSAVRGEGGYQPTPRRPRAPLVDKESNQPVELPSTPPNQVGSAFNTLFASSASTGKGDSEDELPTVPAPVAHRASSQQPARQEATQKNAAEDGRGAAGKGEGKKNPVQPTSPDTPLAQLKMLRGMTRAGVRALRHELTRVVDDSANLPAELELDIKVAAEAKQDLKRIADEMENSTFQLKVQGRLLADFKAGKRKRAEEVAEDVAQE